MVDLPSGSSVAKKAGEAWQNALKQRGGFQVGSLFLLGLGLLLVLSSRGCEALSTRNVAALQAELKLSQSHFDDTWEAKRQSLSDQLEQLRNKKDFDPVKDKAESDRLLKEQQQQADDMAKQRQEMEKGSWHSMNIAARDADAEALSSAYWHQFWFTVGTILLAFGLLAVGFTGQGAERWICLAMLVILMYSVYVGGVWGGRG